MMLLRDTLAALLDSVALLIRNMMFISTEAVKTVTSSRLPVDFHVDSAASTRMTTVPDVTVVELPGAIERSSLIVLVPGLLDLFKAAALKNDTRTQHP